MLKLATIQCANDPTRANGFLVKNIFKALYLTKYQADPDLMIRLKIVLSRNEP